MHNTKSSSYDALNISSLSRNKVLQAIFKSCFVTWVARRGKNVDALCLIELERDIGVSSLQGLSMM